MFVITSKNKEKVIATNSFVEAWAFITKNKDAKIRTIDFNAKPKIMDKRVFLKAFYESTFDKNNPNESKNKFFQIAEIMVKGRTNLNELINLLGLREDYRAYKNNINLIP